jgi:hypothetical protein
MFNSRKNQVYIYFFIICLGSEILLKDSDEMKVAFTKKLKQVKLWKCLILNCLEFLPLPFYI